MATREVIALWPLPTCQLFAPTTICLELVGSIATNGSFCASVVLSLLTLVLANGRVTGAPDAAESRRASKPMNTTLVAFVVLYLLGTLALGVWAGTRGSLTSVACST